MTGSAALFQHDARQPWPVAPASVHLICGSPPYYGAKRKVTYDLYDYAPSLPTWAEDLAAVARQAYQALAPGGRLVVNVANSERKPYHDLASLAGGAMVAAGFELRGQVIWDKGRHTLGTGWGSWQLASAPSLRDQHEYLVIGQKGARLDVAGYPRRAWLPKDFASLTASVWRINPESAKRVGHPAPYPVELARRLVRLYTAPGMLVLDPWLGSGSTAIAALLEECRSVGFDLSARYLDIARARIHAAGAGSCEVTHGLCQNAA